MCFYVVFLFSSLNSYNLLFNQKDGTSYRNCISLAKWSYFRFRYQTFHLNIDNFQTNQSHSCLIWLKPHFFNAWVNPILSAVSVVQGVPPICWQLRTKIWKLKHHICQKISPVLKFLNKKLSDGRFRWHSAKSFLISNLKILPIWFSQVSRCHLKDFYSRILKQGLLFAICDFSIFKIWSEVVNLWVGHSVLHLK